MDKKIIKRDGRIEIFDDNKIHKAIKKAFLSTRNSADEEKINELIEQINSIICEDTVSVEEIQDIVEKVLMDNEYYDVVRNYILYRENRNKLRQYRYEIAKLVPSYNIYCILKDFQRENFESKYDLEKLFNKYQEYSFIEMDEKGKLISLIRSSEELIDSESPNWDNLAFRLFIPLLYNQIKDSWKKFDLNSFETRLKLYVSKYGYDKDLVNKYNEEELKQIEKMVNKSRDKLLTLSTFKKIYNNYLVKIDGKIIEPIQEFYLIVSMILAKNEEEKLAKVNYFYNLLSKQDLLIDNNLIINIIKNLSL